MLLPALSLLMAGLVACSGDADVSKADDTAGPVRLAEKPAPPPRTYESAERKVSKMETEEIQLLCTLSMNFVRDVNHEIRGDIHILHYYLKCQHNHFP